jgi:hypothetical protein
MLVASNLLMGQSIDAMHCIGIIIIRKAIGQMLLAFVTKETAFLRLLSWIRPTCFFLAIFIAPLLFYYSTLLFSTPPPGSSHSYPSTFLFFIFMFHIKIIYSHSQVIL